MRFWREKRKKFMEPKILEKEEEKSKKTKGIYELIKNGPKPVKSNTGNEMCRLKRASWQLSRKIRSARADLKASERFKTESSPIFSP